MLDFLSTRDYVFLVVILLLVLVIVRLVRVLLVQDFYRSWVHLIKPALLIVLVFGVYVMLDFGYFKTKRIWDNLAYIQSYNIGDPLLVRPSNWAEAGVNPKDIDRVRLRIDSLFEEQRKAWPISLVENHDEQQKITIALDGVNSDSLELYIHRKTSWNNELDSLLNTIEYRANLNALHVIDSLHSEIQKLNRNVIVLDSIYSMKIDTWLVTDSLRVRFMKEKNTDFPETSL